MNKHENPFRSIVAPIGALIMMNFFISSNITAQYGSDFRSVTIGRQVWMLENLNTGRFRNGDPIPEARTREEWQKAGKQGKPAWCYYENDKQNGEKYGKLYNWYAVSDPRGLAPEGWHIPSADEWTSLADRYGGRRVAAPELKSASGWACEGNGNNISGFTGLPGGIRTAEGDFQYMEQYGYWWSATEYNDLYGYYRYMYNRGKYLYGYVNYMKESGFSVRCIRDMTRERELSLRTPEVFINPPESKYSRTKRVFQGIPGIERASNGRLWMSRFSGGGGEGGPANHALLITSGDDGQTWSDLKVVADMPDQRVRLYDPCVWIDPLGRLWFIWAQAYSPHVDCGVWAIVTENPEDANPEWSAPRRLCEGIMLNKPTVLSNGDWLLPTTIWKIDNSCRVVVSEDQGESFRLRGTANIPDSSHRCPDEPMIVQRNDGSLWMLVRTSYGMGESISEDGGRTWSPVSRASIKHATARFHIRRLQSGNLLLIKHGPVYERIHRERLTAYLSKDDGKSWEGGLLLDERHPVSYPDAVQAPDGSIYAVYDHGRYAGTVREIMMAVFREEDVLAGRPSGKTRLKVVINRAEEPDCEQKNY